MKDDNHLCNAICSECADRFGATMPKDHICSWWIGICDACEQEHIMITSVRDFRFPKIKKGQYKL